MDSQTLNEIRQLVLGDFASTVLVETEVRLIELDPTRLDDSRLADAASWISLHDPTAHRILIQVAGNVTAIDDDDTVRVTVAMASALQDYVMDQIAAPWPEFVLCGRTTVLEPMIGSDGAARWGTTAHPDICRIGQLANLLAG